MLFTFHVLVHCVKIETTTLISPRELSWHENSFAEEAGLVYRFIRRNKVRTMSLIPFSRLSAVRVLIVNYLVVHIDSQLLVSFTTSFCREIDLDWSD